MKWFIISVLIDFFPFYIYQSIGDVKFYILPSLIINFSLLYLTWSYVALENKFMLKLVN